MTGDKEVAEVLKTCRLLVEMARLKMPERSIASLVQSNLEIQLKKLDEIKKRELGSGIVR